MKVLTSQDAEAQYKADVKVLIEQYGSPSAVPRDEWFYVSETLRANHCLLINPTWTVEQVVAHYSIDRRVAENLFGIEKDELLSRRTKRSDKYDKLAKWCEENVLAQVTPNELAEVGEISYQTALKYISDNPNNFRKVTRGRYEIRDPKSDRKAEKEAGE
jgi:hypothetical protein